MSEDQKRAIEADMREQMPGWTDSEYAELVQIHIEQRQEQK